MNDFAGSAPQEPIDFPDEIRARKFAEAMAYLLHYWAPSPHFRTTVEFRDRDEALKVVFEPQERSTLPGIGPR